MWADTFAMNLIEEQGRVWENIFESFTDVKNPEPGAWSTPNSNLTNVII